jgi:hypothetical protein
LGCICDVDSDSFDFSLSLEIDRAVQFGTAGMVIFLLLIFLGKDKSTYGRRVRAKRSIIQKTNCAFAFLMPVSHLLNHPACRSRLLLAQEQNHRNSRPAPLTVETAVSGPQSFRKPAMAASIGDLADSPNG